MGTVSAAYRGPPQAHLDRIASLAERIGEPVECPCDDASLCRPTYKPDGDFARDHEIFGFSSASSGGKDHHAYDWSILSTIAWANDDSLMCEAHKHGARVVMSAPNFGGGIPANATARQAWIDKTLAIAKAGHYDGVTFDYESAIGADQPELMAAYIDIVSATQEQMHAQIPGSQISVCVAWSPDNIDGRAYDCECRHGGTGVHHRTD